MRLVSGAVGTLGVLWEPSAWGAVGTLGVLWEPSGCCGNPRLGMLWEPLGCCVNTLGASLCVWLVHPWVWLPLPLFSCSSELLNDLQ